MTRSQTKERTGTPGLDVFKIAQQTISGWLPSQKVVAGPPRQPYTTLVEQALGLYLEFHPWVMTYQRGDVSEAFARAHRLSLPLGTPFAISYVFDGIEHVYLPDWVGRLTDGTLFIAEAGLVSDKSTGAPLAKAAAARHVARVQGGVYWLGTDESLVRQRYWNYVFLHTRRRSFPAFEEIAPVVRSLWLGDTPLSVSDLTIRLGEQWSMAEVQGAAWKVAADAAATGYLLVDLDEVALRLDTPLLLLPPDQPPILPPDLPTSLEQTTAVCRVDGNGADEGSDDEPLASTLSLPGPTVDASYIESEERRAAFLRNCHAMIDLMTGRSLGAVAAEYGMTKQRLCVLRERLARKGQIALVPYLWYDRQSTMRDEFKAAIKKMYIRRSRPTVTAIAEHYKLQRLAEKLSTAAGTTVLVPSYWQVYRYCVDLDRDPDVQEERSGQKHPPRRRMSTASYVLSIPGPGVVCQVDEHYLDINVVALDGTVITHRVHGAVLICVKTGALLGFTLSLEHLKEEDYMRLVKQAMEPKEWLTRLYGCRHSWSCTAMPSIILHDRGKIFTSAHAVQVLVDRLGIITEQAPPFAPTVKGTVEALFTWVSRKFTHRLPGTRKSNPADLGAYDVEKDAAQAGITLDVLEELFTQAIVDDYMQDWDTLRRQARAVLWDDAVAVSGVPRWLGAEDDLKLLLMKAVNRKNAATGRYAIHPSHGISFHGRWYVNPGLLDRLRGVEVDIYFDRRDISVIYFFADGVYMGEAFCADFTGRKSWWEAEAERKADRTEAKAARATALANRQGTQEQAHRGKRAQYKETVRLEQARQLDQQRPDIHPAHVTATLRALEESQRARAEPLQDVPREDLAPAVPDATIIPLRRPTIRQRGGHESS